MLYNHSKPQYPHLQAGANISYIVGLLWGLNESTWLHIQGFKEEGLPYSAVLEVWNSIF